MVGLGQAMNAIRLIGLFAGILYAMIGALAVIWLSQEVKYRNLDGVVRALLCVGVCMILSYLGFSFYGG